MFFGCEKAGSEGLVDPRELSEERDLLSGLSHFFIPFRMEFRFTLVLYSKGLYSVEERGRDFEFDINFLKQNWRDVPQDRGRGGIKDTLNCPPQFPSQFPRIRNPPPLC